MFTKGLRGMNLYGLVQLVVLLLAYLVPYTVLLDTRGWLLYVYWLILGVVSVIVAWVGTRGWSKHE